MSTPRTDGRAPGVTLRIRMLLRWLFAVLAFACFQQLARGEPGAPGASGAPGAVSAGGPARAPAPAAQLEHRAARLLPPGVRSSRRAGGLGWTAPGSSGSGVDRRVELVRAADSEERLEVQYTIDPQLDAQVRALLETSGVELGHVVLMDPHSGEIFSYVSTEPALFPALRAYPTASLMKVVTAAAVLRNAPEAALRDCRYLGSPYAELDPADLRAPVRGGWVDPFSRALAISNNPCFARLAVLDVGAEALIDEMQRLGLLESPAVLHEPGRVDPIEDELDLANLGSGLAGSAVTALAAARMSAVLADGQLVRPHWIAGVRDGRGELRWRPPTRARRAWSPALADQLRELMVGTTTHGTARHAFLDEAGEPRLGPVRVSGKTGTLSGSDPDGRYHWFVGVAPAEAPTLSLATLVVSRPGEETGAVDVAVGVLDSIFCHHGRCRASEGRRLRERAAARRAAWEAEGRTAQEELREAGELDATPRLAGIYGIDLPPRLLRRHPGGRVVVEVELGPDGRVLDARVEESQLPELEELLLDQVREWRFTPPTQNGRPVRARARLPIRID